MSGGGEFRCLQHYACYLQRTLRPQRPPSLPLPLSKPPTNVHTRWRLRRPLCLCCPLERASKFNHELNSRTGCITRDENGVKRKDIVRFATGAQQQIAKTTIGVAAHVFRPRAFGLFGRGGQLCLAKWTPDMTNSVQLACPPPTGEPSGGAAPTWG